MGWLSHDNMKDGCCIEKASGALLGSSDPLGVTSETRTVFYD